jgi:Protein of unknown function (DUF2652)
MGEMYFPGLIPLIILVLVLLAAILLVLFFRRPVPDGYVRLSSLEFINSSKDEKPIKTDLDAGIEGGGALERDTYLVIPDISGYTRFLSLNRFSLSHAQHVISQLLNAVIEGATPQLIPAKIEGDAILFFGLADQSGKLVGADLGTTIVSLLSKFYAKREQLQRSNLCPCNACQRIGELDIKVVVHRGPVLRYRLGTFPELSGVSVIAVHRLLKNCLSMQRYVMVTEEAFPCCKLPLNLAASSHIESYSDVGEITSYVYAFEIDDVLSTDSSASDAPARASTKDLAQKLSRNARSLVNSIGFTR